MVIELSLSCLDVVCRSGTEEEYSELSQLLKDISSYMRDLNALKVTQAKEKAAQLKKAQEDKRKAEEMRLAAMEGISSEMIFFLFDLFAHDYCTLYPFINRR